MQYPITKFLRQPHKNLDHTMISVLVIGYVNKTFFFNLGRMQTVNFSERIDANS